MGICEQERSLKIQKKLAGSPGIIVARVDRRYFSEVDRAEFYQAPGQKLFRLRAGKAVARCAAVRSIEDVQGLGL